MDCAFAKGGIGLEQRGESAGDACNLPDVEKLKTRPIAARKLLLKTGDGALEAELCRRQADQSEDNQCEYDLDLHQAFMSRKGVSWA